MDASDGVPVPSQPDAEGDDFGLPPLPVVTFSPLTDQELSTLRSVVEAINNRLHGRFEGPISDEFTTACWVLLKPK